MQKKQNLTRVVLLHLNIRKTFCHRSCQSFQKCLSFPPEQIDQLRRIVDELEIPVLCFGLRSDFQTKLFPGSRRLFELADSIQEIKTICDCGSKATVNARIDSDGYVVTEGAQVVLGGNDCYIAMCHRCWQRAIAEHRKVKLHKH